MSTSAGASAGFRHWMASTGQLIGTDPVDAAQNGDPTAIAALHNWLAADGLLVPLLGVKKPRKVRFQPAVCTALARLVEKRVASVNQIRLALIGDFEKDNGETVWNLRACPPYWPARRAVLLPWQINDLKVLGGFGRNGDLPAADAFLVAWSDGSPWNEKQIRYAISRAVEVAAEVE